MVHYVPYFYLLKKKLVVTVITIADMECLTQQ